MASSNEPPSFRGVLFGSVMAELTTKATLHPFDTLKTRMQYLVLPKRSTAIDRVPIISDIRLAWRILQDATKSPHHSMVEAAARGHNERSTWQALAAVNRSLFRGVGPQLLGILPVAIVYMPTYEFTKSAACGSTLEKTPVAAVTTGMVSAVVRSPVSLIKSRMQLGLHTSLPSAVRHACTHGTSGLFVGLRATAVHDVCYAIAQFTCLEQLRRLVLAVRAPTTSEAGRDPSQLCTADNAAIGFATGVLAAVITEPLDVIKTRLMAQQPGRGEGSFGYSGLVHGLQTAARSEGLLSLWKGLAPRLLIKALGSTIWYMTYMEARRAFALMDCAPSNASRSVSGGSMVVPLRQPPVKTATRRQEMTCLDE